MLTSLGIIFIVGILSRIVCSKIKLPSLIGMIVGGILIGPHMLSLLDNIILELSPQLRELALVIVLTRAGLSLNTQDLRDVGRPAFRLCFIPAILEIVGIMFLSSWILNIEITDAILIGCVLAAVSPAIIVPHMIKMMEEGYGINKKIPQMILAGASVDDIFVIILFTSALTFANSGNISWKEFIEVPISILFGIFIGMITTVMYLEITKRCNFTNSSIILVLFLLSTSFFILELQEKTRNILPFSALLAIMSMGIMINNRNKTIAILLSKEYKKLWVVAEIVLFVLVGASVNTEYLITGGTFAIIIVISGLCFRMFGVWLSIIGTSLNKNEKAFCMIAYTPKATVQAAIGGIPLALGLSCGENILIIAVIAILLTAPFGAMCMEKYYKRWTVKIDDV